MICFGLIASFIWLSHNYLNILKLNSNVQEDFTTYNIGDSGLTNKLNKVILVLYALCWEVHLSITFNFLIFENN